MNTLYIDMDGVVADFDQATINLFNPTAEELAEARRTTRWGDDKWQQIIQTPNFFRHIPKMPRADELMALARRFRDELGWSVYMLTAIPSGNDVPDCIQDKVEWQQEYYPDIRVRFGPYAKDKQKFCQGNDILVDDKPSNCVEWMNRTGPGGLALLVTQDYSQVLTELQALFDIFKARA